MRILNLLEQHHKKLGQLLKSRHGRPALEEEGFAEHPANTAPPYQTGASVVSANSHQGASSNAGSNEPHPPRLSKAARPSARDLSSSIASNLASARGIPSNRQRRPQPVSPTVSAQHAGGRFATEGRIPRTFSRHGSEKSSHDRVATQQNARPSWAPPSGATDSETSVDPAGLNKAGTSDAPFQQFYSTFESLMSKISAPLAFTGLPLTSAPPAASPRPSRPQSPALRSQRGRFLRCADHSTIDRELGEAEEARRNLEP